MFITTTTMMMTTRIPLVDFKKRAFTVSCLVRSSQLAYQCENWAYFEDKETKAQRDEHPRPGVGDREHFGSSGLWSPCGPGAKALDNMYKVLPMS